MGNKISFFGNSGIENSYIQLGVPPAAAAGGKIRGGAIGRMQFELGNVSAGVNEDENIRDAIMYPDGVTETPPGHIGEIDQYKTEYKPKDYYEKGGHDYAMNPYKPHQIHQTLRLFF